MVVSAVSDTRFPRAPTFGEQPPGAQSGSSSSEGDRVTISREARGRQEDEVRGRAGAAEQLTPDQQRLVESLVQRDREVRAHEAAHQAVAGALGGAAHFTFETGPDGRSYAVGGEVRVSLREGRTPEETIANARQVRASALAPADPSPQDLRVASAAAAMEARATAELRAGAGNRRPEQRGTHLHAQEPCGACAAAARRYSQDSGSATA
jgi:hypothetical protein